VNEERKKIDRLASRGTVRRSVTNVKMGAIASKPRIEPQDSSPIFNLPAEIRELIYDYVVPEQTISIILRENGQLHGYLDEYYGKCEVQVNILSVLLSCRLLYVLPRAKSSYHRALGCADFGIRYSEIFERVYTRPKFTFMDSFTFFFFLRRLFPAGSTASRK
jgi:hypothetical protein